MTSPGPQTEPVSTIPFATEAFEYAGLARSIPLVQEVVDQAEQEVLNRAFQLIDSGELTDAQAKDVLMQIRAGRRLVKRLRTHAEMKLGAPKNGSQFGVDRPQNPK